MSIYKTSVRHKTDKTAISDFFYRKIYYERKSQKLVSYVSYVLPMIYASALGAIARTAKG
jgi:hypothetical protein